MVHHRTNHPRGQDGSANQRNVDEYVRRRFFIGDSTTETPPEIAQLTFLNPQPDEAYGALAVDRKQNRLFASFFDHALDYVNHFTGR